MVVIDLVAHHCVVLLAWVGKSGILVGNVAVAIFDAVRELEAQTSSASSLPSSQSGSSSHTQIDTMQ